MTKHTEVGRLVDALNARPLSRRGGSRDDAFFGEERASLHPLPEAPFEWYEWRRCKASPDYHVQCGYMRYSVPYRLVARGRESRRRLVCGVLLALVIAIALAFACLVVLGSPYSHWDFADPELAVARALYHGFEWVFVRIAPIALVVAIAGLFLLRKRG